MDFQKSDKDNRERRYRGVMRPRRRVPMGTVIMPNMDEVSITEPTPIDCKCQKRATTIFLPLRPDGQMSGREYRVVKEQMDSSIVVHANNRGGVFSSYDIVKINKLKNCCLWKRYVNRQHDLNQELGRTSERMLFHGSAKLDDIVATGFDERHSSPKGYFGAGIYFAHHSSKSNQYSLGFLGGKGCIAHNDISCYICERKMLLCRVLLGNIFQSAQPVQMSHPPPGYHSVEGMPSPGYLLYSEYVIYRGEQAYPEYEITYKLVK